MQNHKTMMASVMGFLAASGGADFLKVFPNVSENQKRVIKKTEIDYNAKSKAEEKRLRKQTMRLKNVSK